MGSIFRFCISAFWTILASPEWRANSGAETAPDPVWTQRLLALALASIVTWFAILMRETFVHHGSLAQLFAVMLVLGAYLNNFVPPLAAILLLALQTVYFALISIGPSPGTFREPFSAPALEIGGSFLLALFALAAAVKKPAPQG